MDAANSHHSTPSEPSELDKPRLRKARKVEQLEAAARAQLCKAQQRQAAVMHAALREHLQAEVKAARKAEFKRGQRGSRAPRRSRASPFSTDLEDFGPVDYATCTAPLRVCACLLRYSAGCIEGLTDQSRLRALCDPHKMPHNLLLAS